MFHKSDINPNKDETVFALYAFSSSALDSAPQMGSKSWFYVGKEKQKHVYLALWPNKFFI